MSLSDEAVLGGGEGEGREVDMGSALGVEEVKGEAPAFDSEVEGDTLADTTEVLESIWGPVGSDAAGT